jgi:hypothetical protein
LSTAYVDLAVSATCQTTIAATSTGLPSAADGERQHPPESWPAHGADSDVDSGTSVPDRSGVAG